MSRTSGNALNKNQTWKNTPKPWHGSGFYETIDIESLDNRTTMGKSVQALKSGLRYYVGDSTIAAELLISRIVYKTIKLSLYEAKCLQDPQHKEAPHYLPMANSLRIDLQTLAQMAGKVRPPNLDEYISQHYEVDK